MPTFDWRTSNAEADSESGFTEPWEAMAARYDLASDARGLDEWKEFIAQLRKVADGEPGPDADIELRILLNILIDALRHKPILAQPTVFVSHQRLDAPWAEWIAWAATEAQFDYWLDIHDPKLMTLNAVVLPPQLKSVLVAGIIEMALTNSSHIVSMQTMNSQNSRWVPYEFGRIKERNLLAMNTASWFESGTTPNANGDYLWLAICTFTSADLRTWLNTQGRTPSPRPNLRWPFRVPTPLPN